MLTASCAKPDSPPEDAPAADVASAADAAAIAGAESDTPSEEFLAAQTAADAAVAAAAAADAAAATSADASFTEDYRPIQPATGLYFHDDPCTIDCSGHEAGYEWAERNEVEDPSDCGGRSQSFIEGCETYAEELEAQREEEQQEEDGGDYSGY